MMKPDTKQDEASAPTTSSSSSSGYRLPRFTWGSGDSAKSNSSEEGSQSRFRISRTTWGVLAFFLVVIVVTLSLFFATRPETVQVIETAAEETLPSLIKVAPIGTTTGAILIEYTELLQDNSTVFYYLSAQDLNLTTLEGVTDPDDVALYLTRSSNPTIEDLQTLERRALLPVNETETSLRIGFLSNVAFPFKLPDFFFPGDFNGAILVEERQEEAIPQVISVATFSVVVDPEQNVGSAGTITTSVPTLSPTTQFPTSFPSRKTTASPSSTPSKSPTASPTTTPTTKSPTQSPTLSPTTALPTAKPTSAPSPGPTFEPTVSPTAKPTASPTTSPTAKPSPQPSPQPTSKATISPQPSLRGSTPPPTRAASLPPTNMPTSRPSRKPTSLPSKAPSKSPTTTPTPLPTNKPSTAPSGKPTNLPSANPTAMPTSQPSSRPTQEPTRNPTKFPTKFPTAEPTVSPTKKPVDGSSLPILTAELTGSYSIDGTITIDYVQGFEDGQVVNRPRLQFDIPNLSNAPGPYLYLSKRSYSETRDRDLEDEDIFIPIDSGEDGQFNVKGRFDQFLDEFKNVQDLEDYTNGSWIVWCGPFGVWIGGGGISAS